MYWIYLNIIDIFAYEYLFLHYMELEWIWMLAARMYIRILNALPRRPGAGWCQCCQSKDALGPGNVFPRSFDLQFCCSKCFCQGPNENFTIITNHSKSWKHIETLCLHFKRFHVQCAWMRVNEIDLISKVPLLLLGILKAIATASLRSVGLGLLAEVGWLRKRYNNMKNMGNFKSWNSRSKLSETKNTIKNTNQITHNTY